MSSIRDELFGYSVSDPVLGRVLEGAWALVVEAPSAAALDQVRLCIINPAVASPELQASQYFTSSFQALRAEQLLVVNEQFLLDVELAVRSFAQSESLLGLPFLKSDEQLFGLVRRIHTDQGRSLARLRRQAQRTTADAGAEELLQREMTLVTLFFLGHELGHLLGGHPTGQFATFIDPNAPLAQQHEDAVVKLCRHVDEFAPTQFGLPGFGEIADRSSAPRRAADALRARDESRYQRQEAFFGNETAADAWANRIMTEHLTMVAARSPLESEQDLYLLARGVFAAALFTWYRDLAVFGHKLMAEDLHTSESLASAMMQGREPYVHASALFGDSHRFTLLRGALALESIMRARTRWFDLPTDQRSIWSADEGKQVRADDAARRAWWLSECLQRYFLLCICMDTAVKIATIGCATGWLRKKDGERGTPQMLVMNFESIGRAVERLQRIP